jgi:uncharacterized protein
LKQHFVLTWKAKNNIISRLSRNGSGLKRITDAFVFAREGRVLQGTLPVSGFERMQDLLVDTTGDLDFVLQGYKTEHGKYMLHLAVSGALLLACQRCLLSIPLELDVDSLLELIPEGGDMSQDELEDDTRDFLPVAGELNVVELVEDEILLNLPFAPMHQNCGLPGADGVGERINPFAALAGLKGRPN